MTELWQVAVFVVIWDTICRMLGIANRLENLGRRLADYFGRFGFWRRHEDSQGDHGNAK